MLALYTDPIHASEFAEQALYHRYFVILRVTNVRRITYKGEQSRRSSPGVNTPVPPLELQQNHRHSQECIYLLHLSCFLALPKPIVRFIYKFNHLC